MSETEDAVGVLNEVYAAAEGQGSWSDSLAGLADWVGYEAATFEVHNLRTGQMLDIVSARVDPEDMAEYARDFSSDNPRVNYLKQGQTRISFDHLFISETEMDRHVFYADFLRPKQLKYFVSVETPLVDGEVRMAMALQRSGRVSGVDEHAIRRLATIEPHLTRAMRLYWGRMKARIDADAFPRRLKALGLTVSEQQLALSFAAGESLSDFARRKGVTMNTVYTHYRRVKEKLDCRDKAGLSARLVHMANGYLS
ncbi:hypothetical protein [uncultured Litoreibacter sp.]|uniref:helix-turn-helix transcriptional regulator n=1 Tax=uncultured Litoreibacter sp. TaxID=1392394 RepID=UPI0026079AE2|nr:hypothetical protein [uncultured Litoreibacter sp.]